MFVIDSFLSCYGHSLYPSPDASASSHPPSLSASNSRWLYGHFLPLTLLKGTCAFVWAFLTDMTQLTLTAAAKEQSIPLVGCLFKGNARLTRGCRGKNQIHSCFCGHLQNLSWVSVLTLGPVAFCLLAGSRCRPPGGKRTDTAWGHVGYDARPPTDSPSSPLSFDWHGDECERPRERTWETGRRCTKRCFSPHPSSSFMRWARPSSSLTTGNGSLHTLPVFMDGLSNEALQLQMPTSVLFRPNCFTDLCTKMFKSALSQDRASGSYCHFHLICTMTPK